VAAKLVKEIAGRMLQPSDGTSVRQSG
jgi:hypothetical protein